MRKKRWVWSRSELRSRALGASWLRKLMRFALGLYLMGLIGLTVVWAALFGIDDLGENWYGLHVLALQLTASVAWLAAVAFIAESFTAKWRDWKRKKAPTPAGPVWDGADAGGFAIAPGPRLEPSRPADRLRRFWRKRLGTMDAGRALLIALCFSNLILAYAPIEFAGRRPLHRAARWGNAHLTRILAEVSNVNERTASGGYTPLYYAAFRGHAKVVRVLLEAGADPNVRTEQGGYTPLYHAARGGHAEMVRDLLQANADINARTARTNSTPLYTAAFRGHAEIVRALLKAGADVNTRTARAGATPLYAAARNGHAEIVRALLAAGADPNIRTKRTGSTPLTVAQSRNHTETIALLEAAGAT